MDACGVERRFFASGSPRDYNRYQDKWLPKSTPPTHPPRAHTGSIRIHMRGSAAVKATEGSPITSSTTKSQILAA